MKPQDQHMTHQICNHVYKILILGFALLLINFNVNAQSMADIQNIKVDNLSDAQIEQLIMRAESSGMNEMQLEAYAAERGMPPMEIAKLRQRIDQLRRGGREGRDGRTDSRRPARSQQSRTVEGFDMDEDLFDSLRKSDPYFDLTPEQKKIFGYTLFHNRNLNFNPSLNVPTPPSYVIGAGDQLLIDVYGASQQSYELKVTPEGRILIPNVGPVEVGGSSVEAATARIRSSLSRIYSGLGGGSPNTFLEVRLGNIRTISVSLVGELNRPGNYTLPSFASVFNALFAAGGPNEKGSFRHIQVYRGNQLRAEVDIYDFLTKGKFSSEFDLKDNDVVIVPPVRNRVELEGAVRREGYFEMKGDESIQDLIEYGGGFSSNAYRNRVNVRRLTGTQLSVNDLEAAQFEQFTMRDGDVISVGEVLRRYDNRVQITGAVYRPGEFAIPEGGLGVKDLIRKAEGLTGDAFTGRAILYRTKENLDLEAISVDVGAILNDEIEDVKLRREDVLSIPSRYDLKEEYYVRISGEVNIPGAYTYAESLTVAGLVAKAGGLKDAASSSYIEIARRVKNDVSGKIAELINIEIDPELRILDSEENITLQPFDHIFIRRSPGFQREKIVTVEGEVNFPGEFVLSNANERISDLLKRAGGLNQFAYAKGATLIRRTEYYEVTPEDELKEKNLKSVREQLDNKDLMLTEAEEIFLERLSRKLLEKEERRLKRRINEEEEEDLRASRLLDVVDTTSVKIDFKPQELVGINLQAILENPGTRQDLILQEGDILSIPKELQTVRMRGQVLFPTTARYQESRGLRSYVGRAGGFTEMARKKKSYVIYANGDVRRTRNFLFLNFYPHIEPGAEIIVPRKPDRTPMTPQQWVAIGSGLATLGLVIVQIVNLSNQQ